MQLDIKLCRQYIYSDEPFWTKAQAMADVLLGDAIFLDFFETFQTCLCVNHSMEEASQVYQRSLDYIRLFYAQTIDFYPAVLLGLCLPVTIRQFQDKGIEDAIIRDTLMDFAIWAREYERRYGRQGIGEVSWIFLPYTHKIFRLNRLQFELGSFDQPYFIFKHKETGMHTAFASPDCLVDEMGNMANGRENFTLTKTTLTLDGSILTGYPADFQRATVGLKPAQIDLNEWTCVLSPGRRVLNIHIPAEEPLDPLKVDASLAHAKQFFGKMGYPVDYGVCFSWLVDTHLQNIALEDSNVVSFMRRFYKLSSAPSNYPSILERVFGFGFKWEQLEMYEPKSRLQKSLKAYLLQGGMVVDMAGFIVIGD